jgi:Zn-dependent peptidase ImmA (M78 family)
MDCKMLAQSVHVDRGVLRRDSMSSGGIDEIEIAANAFAACLLMPERLIRLVLRQSIDLEDEALVGQLARKFGVSSAALTNRILNLSLG